MTEYDIHPSIMQTECECFICGKKGENVLQHHEVFFGCDRRKSIQNGLWVYLCVDHHTGEKRGVHHDPELNRKLKKSGQEYFERKHSHEEFMKIFKKNYR